MSKDYDNTTLRRQRAINKKQPVKIVNSEAMLLTTLSMGSRLRILAKIESERERKLAAPQYETPVVDINDWKRR